MKISSVALASCIGALWAAVPVAADFAYGLPWAADNRWAGSMTDKTVSWYHHWQDGKVSTINKNVEFVPMYWGPKKKSHWNHRKIDILKHSPNHILAFNEPDIETQAGMTPKEAADEFMKELQPFAEKGINVSTPQMVYDIGWLESFMKHCKSKGCKISFVALHWYGGHQDLDAFTHWIETVHNKFNLPIWVTEFGLTSASNPSEHQVKKFMQKAIDWMSSKDYVERAAWNGCYDVNDPPDGFATPLNAFFSTGGSLRDLAHTWLAGKGNKRIPSNNNDDEDDSSDDDSKDSDNGKGKRQLAHAVMQKRRNNVWN
ncbi:hypothetical protein MCAP1_002949 [Malassezia caprae]|uniref:Asl1-like glycosyl hydrolase catalytic domain-containing protein n=1 Tax=Malassezia caprae TaxID=1381934 RepID=A0AAF0E6Q6_9BASI|nr:hypothetical protein MCAP1_002949 [Malassezia caprae]